MVAPTFRYGLDVRCEPGAHSWLGDQIYPLRGRDDRFFRYELDDQIYRLRGKGGQFVQRGLDAHFFRHVLELQLVQLEPDVQFAQGVRFLLDDQLLLVDLNARCDLDDRNALNFCHVRHRGHRGNHGHHRDRHHDHEKASLLQQ